MKNMNKQTSSILIVIGILIVVGIVIVIAILTQAPANNLSGAAVVATATPRASIANNPASGGNPQPAADASTKKKAFVPYVAGPNALAPVVVREIMMGVYVENYLGLQSTIDNEVIAMDTWVGKRLSIVGTFIAIEDLYPEYNIPVPLGLIWDAGYTPFVNLETTKKLADINNYSMDEQIRKMARAFKKWRDDGLAKNQNRRALVAPLQEMNGYWVSYHGTPADYKSAFNRIQYLFSVENASSAVRWVFAPNGWSDPSDPPFEDYYPGDSAVEFTAFSAYNYGYCAAASWKNWDMPEVVYSPYIDRMQLMAPTKKIIVAQTATTAYDQNGLSDASKDLWLKDAYAFLAESEGVAGIVYFNKKLYQVCDWSFYPTGTKYEGYKYAVNRSEYVYKTPGSW